LSLVEQHQTLVHETRPVALDLTSRELLINGVAAAIGERAFDIFVLLALAQGELVSKDEIIQRVWSGVAIGDNTLEVQVSALRKALGAERGLLKTAYGRGYRVLGAWTSGIPNARRAPSDAGAGRSSPSVRSNLPLPTSELFGRDEDISTVLALLGAHKLVTLVGTGGIGKTRLAQAVAHRLLDQQPDGVWMVELGTLSDPAMVPAAVAAALGIDISSGNALEAIVRSMTGKRMVLVLETCEHVVTAAAHLAEVLLRNCVGMQILATSREPLRADGEYLFTVSPLSVPTKNAPVSQMVGHSAVQLFLARANAAAQDFPSDDKTIALVGVVCGHLDGIPLALELASARAATLGMEVLVARLDDRLQLLSEGRRTALPRHQALRATLDWSFDLLQETEQAVLRRLSVFAGAFDIDAAAGIAFSDDVPPDLVVNCVAELVAKSLIVWEADGMVRRYRLLDSTRAYALEKLGHGDERARTARLHAGYILDLFELAEVEWGSRPAADWLASYAACIDDLNGALAWAFAEGGDPVLGGELAARSVPLWVQLSQVSAGMARFERALAGIDAGELRARLHLNAALGGLGMFDPNLIDRREAAWETTLQLARTLGDAAYELKALRALYASRGSNGDFRAMWPIVQAFQAAAALSHDPIDFVTAERLVAHLLHVQGYHSEARMNLQELMARPECRIDAPQVVRYQFDHRAVVRMGLSKIQWLQGMPEKALAGIESNVAEAASLDYVLTLCTVLSEAALPVAYFCGDFAAVDRYAALLRSHDTDAARVAWQGYAECFEGAVAIRRGEVSSGVRTMRSGIDLRRAPGKRWHLVFLLGLLADALAFAGLDGDASAVVDEALALGESTGVEWLRPELLRIKGEVLAQQGSVDAALDCLQRAAALAKAHGALAWELRAATGLARLHRTQGRAGLARKVLAPIYERFTEGELTFDLRQARELLEALA
jgi:predicted ATPase/DNA-binding winged helix-turn-helix (wHTH) protein